MLQFENTGPFVAAPTIFPDVHGVETLFVYIKGTFDLKCHLLPQDQQSPIHVADQFFGEPLTTSIKAPSDITLGKPGTDVLLLGHAHATAGGMVRSTDVSLAVGSVKKTLRVFGKRTWHKSLLGGYSATEPEPFDKVPLRWEHAFGGTVQIPGEPPRSESHPGNAVGVGFRGEAKTKPAAGELLPQIEHPSKLIKSWKDRPAPAGFGPTASHWQPRVSFAGTYDEAWQKTRAPFLPKDFDPRFFHTASEDQQVKGYLQGGEPVEVTGASPGGGSRFALPKYTHEIHVEIGYRWEDCVTRLETVSLDMDAERMTLVWAAQLPCGREALQVKNIELNSSLVL